MRKIILFFLLICGMSLVAQNQIQESENQNVTYSKNLVKLNITNLFLKHVYVSYERVLSKRVSVDIGAGLMPKGNIPYIKSHTGDPGENHNQEDINDATQKTQFQGAIVNVSARIYAGKGWGQGFYVSPYYRYVNYKLSDFDLDLRHYNISSQVDDPRLRMSGSLKAHSIGVLLGTQWLLGAKKNVVLDIWWLGLHYGKANGNIKGTSNVALTDQEAADIQNDLDTTEIDNAYIDIEAKVSNHAAELDMKGPWAGFRMGITLGYRF